MLNEIARNKLDEAAADRRTARACTATKCGKAAAPLQGSDCGGFEARVTFRDHSSVCRPLGNWNSGGRGTPYGVTHTHFAIVSRSASV
jgi:hypothetical protein